jgi:glycosyltransferase involved in cell wall biosynthesis
MDSASAVLSVSAGAYALLAFKPSRPATRFVMQAHGTAIGEVLSTWRTRRPKALAKSAYNLLWLLRDLKTYSSFDCVAAVGDAVYESLRRPPISWFLPEQRVRLVRNGIDTDLFSPDPGARVRVRAAFGWSQDERVVITVCRLHRQKGVDHALRGFSAYAARDPRARYLIVGEGPERGPLEKLSHRLGLASRVTFVGDASRQDVADYLRAGDLFLFTNLREEVGIPLNVLEAAAVGLPAAVSRYLKGVSTEVLNVAPIDPRNHRSMGEALARLLEGSDNASDDQPTSRLPEEYTLKCCVATYRELLF